MQRLSRKLSYALTSRGRRSVLAVLLGLGLLGGCASSPAPAPKPTAGQVSESGVPPKQAKWTSDQKKWYRHAVAAGKHGDWSAAVQWLSKLTDERESGALSADYGLALQKSGRISAAVRVYRHALALDPGLAMAANNLALLLRRQGKFEQARQLLEKAIADNPAKASLHFNLAVLCDLYLLDRSAAIRQYQAYQKLLDRPDRKVAGWIAQLKREQD